MDFLDAPMSATSAYNLVESMAGWSICRLLLQAEGEITLLGIDLPNIPNINLDLFGQDNTITQVSGICIGHSLTVQCPTTTIISIHNTSYDEHQSVVSIYLHYSIA